jgi:helicase MOV-10
MSWNPVTPVEKGGYDQGFRDAGMADMNDFTRRMESLTLAGVESGDEDEDEDANVDKPWREVE